MEPRKIADVTAACPLPMAESTVTAATALLFCPACLWSVEFATRGAAEFARREHAATCAAFRRSLVAGIA